MSFHLCAPYVKGSTIHTPKEIVGATRWVAVNNFPLRFHDRMSFTTATDAVAVANVRTIGVRQSKGIGAMSTSRLPGSPATVEWRKNRYSRKAILPSKSGKCIVYGRQKLCAVEREQKDG